MVEVDHKGKLAIPQICTRVSHLFKVCLLNKHKQTIYPQQCNTQTTLIVFTSPNHEH